MAALESANNLIFILTVAHMLQHSAQVNPLTAYCLLEVLNIPTGGYVVFSAAGSALSRMGIHLAKHAGLKTIGIVRRDEQREELLEHGCHAVVSSASEDVIARIKEITGGEVCVMIPSTVTVITTTAAAVATVIALFISMQQWSRVVQKAFTVTSSTQEL
jgi:NADPH:quinone reductase-like Zn-dependent oxidoreductase